jgi:hypothetical protein
MFFRRPAFPPDGFLPIFEQDSLIDYNPRSYTYEARPVSSKPATLRDFPQSYLEVRGNTDESELYDADDRTFFREMRSSSLEDAYSDEFLKCTKENPEKWLEIGVALDNLHAKIIIHDISGTKSDDGSKQFECLTWEGKSSRSFSEGNIRHLELGRNFESDGRYYYDLLYRVISEPMTYEKYHSVCRLRTTDRTIKYTALLVFPWYYQVIGKDCVTFAHKFLVATIDRVEAEGHIRKERRDNIVKHLVKHNRATSGATGETEGVSRQNESLGDSAGALVTSYLASS